MKKNNNIPKGIRFAVLATDVVCFRIIDNKLNVLLGRVSVPSPKREWGVIGGLIKPDETAEDSAERHLKVKAGIPKIYKEQLYTFSRVDRDSRGRVVSVAYIAPTQGDPHKGKDASIETKWCKTSKLPKLAYDHSEIVEVGIERLRTRLEYTNIAQHLLPKEFTLSDLQNVYEVVLNKRLDKRNFRKKVLSIGILKDTGRIYREGAMRPAALYTFASSKIKIAEIL